MSKAPAPQHGKNHRFTGEMRVKIDESVHGRVTQDDVIELAARILDGETIEGVTLERFTVRDDDENRTEEVEEGEYSFASGFIDTAIPEVDNSRNENGRHNRKGLQTHMRKGKRRSRRKNSD